MFMAMFLNFDPGIKNSTSTCPSSAWPLVVAKAGRGWEREARTTSVDDMRSQTRTADRPRVCS